VFYFASFENTLILLAMENVTKAKFEWDLSVQLVDDE
jgi:hypothetical protein